MRKPNVAFVCVHNSCRSQMAEAIAKLIAADVLQAYSAGTHIAEQINPDAVSIVKERYGIDISQTQRPKTLQDLPAIDIVITMGCNVDCPYLPCRFREDWGLADPTGKGKEAFIQTIELIEKKIRDLSYRITAQTINLD